MKKLIFILICLLCVSFVAANDLSGYPENLGFLIVTIVGDEAPASDVLATVNIAQGIKNDLNIKVESLLVSEAKEKEQFHKINGYKKILIGNPCNNELVLDALGYLQCEQWPYDSGEALIKIYSDGVIVAGSTDNDVRMASKALMEHNGFEGEEIVIKGTMADFTTSKQIKEKNEWQCHSDLECPVVECMGVTVKCVSGKCVEEGLCEVVEPVIPLCDGCFIGEQCVDYGFRTDGNYCSLGKEFLPQKDPAVLCENNFECKSNFCVDSECIEADFFKRIIRWFEEIISKIPK